MRVAFELTATQLDRGGTARAIEQTLPLLETDRRVEIVRVEHEGRVPQNRLGTIRRGLQRELWYLPRRLPKIVAQTGADVLHCPSPLAPAKSPVPMIITLYDAIGWDHPEWLTRENAMQLKTRVPKMLDNGAHLVTSSEYSRRRLSEALELDLDRITSIPLGLDARFTAVEGPEDAARLAALKLSGPFVLTVGTLQPRKNLEAAIAAFEMSGASASHNLAIAGARGWHDDGLIARIAASPARERIVLLGRVSDEELLSLYRGAETFVFPSRYEGFGFPPLEAMACGTPVISTTNTSLAEAVGDAAVMIDPDDPQQIAHEIDRVLGSTDLQRDLVARGSRQAAKFTWPGTANATVDLYEKLLS